MRTTLSRLLLLVLVVAVLPASPTMAATSKSATVLTLAVSPRTPVSYGEAATVTGRLSTKTGAALRGKTVTIWSKRPSASRWTRIGTAQTNRRGGFVFVIPSAKKNTDIQARFAGAKRLKPDRSPVRRVKVRAPFLEITPPAGTARVGDSVVWTGRTLTNNGSWGIELQESSNGTSWDYATSGTVRRGGDFRVEHWIYDPGQRHYRLRLVPYETHVPSLSTPTQIEWQEFSIRTRTLSATTDLPFDATIETRAAHPPVTFSITDGELPPGLEMSDSGRITGVPTADGNYSVEVHAWDSWTAEDTATITITAGQSADPLILDTTLPPAQLGVGYAYRIRGTGGTAPREWSVVSGTLPAGLSLNPATGLVSGVPTTVGSSAVTVRLQDAAGSTVTRALALAVTAPANWSQRLGDAARTGSSNDRTITAPDLDRVQTEWMVPRTDGDAVVAYGMLYEGGRLPGSDASGLIARDVATGEVTWTVPLVDQYGGTSSCAHISVTPSAVICAGGVMAAVSRTGDHDVLWSSVDIDAGLQVQDLAVSGTSVLVTRYDGPAVTSFRLSDGLIQWSRPLSTGHNPSGLAVGTDQVYVMDGQALRAFALNASGTPLWTQALGTFAPMVAVDVGVLIATSDRLEWRSAATGAVLRTYDPEVQIFGQPVVDAQRVYLPMADFNEWGSYNTGVHAVRLSDATKAWEIDTSVPIRSGMAVAGSVLWVHASDLGRNRVPSDVVAVRTSDGHVLRTFRPDDTSYTAPLIGGGRVIVRTAYKTHAYGLMAPAVRVPEQVLPTGRAGQSYQAHLSADPGPDVTWSRVSGSLPTGLSLSPDGSVTGTPGAAGTHTFTVRATSTVGRSDTRLVTVVVRPVGTTTWTSMAGDRTRNAASLVANGMDTDSVATFGLRWSTAASGTGSAWPSGPEEPLVAGSRLFGLDLSGHLSAYSTATGTNRAPLWTSAPGDHYFTGTPTLVGTSTTGTLYITDTGGALHALSASTGDPLWHVGTTTGYFHAQTSPLVVGTHVFVATNDDLVAVDTATHAVAWSKPLNDAGDSFTASAASDGVRIYAYTRCEVIAIRPGDGATLWRSRIPAPGGPCNPVSYYPAGAVPPQRSAPVVHDGVVYANSAYDGAAAFDARTGDVLWRNRIGGTDSAPVVTEQWLVLSDTSNHRILLADRDTGELVATSQAGAFEVRSSLALAGDLVFFRSEEGRIRAVDLVTMQSVWTSPAMYWGDRHPPVISGNRIYTFTFDGQFRGFGPP